MIFSIVETNYYQIDVDPNTLKDLTHTELTDAVKKLIRKPTLTETDVFNEDGSIYYYDGTDIEENPEEETDLNEDFEDEDLSTEDLQ